MSVGKDEGMKKYEETRLDNMGIGARVAQEFNYGDCVNVGFGIPSFAPSFIPPDKKISTQVECGVLNAGDMVNPDDPDELWDHDLFNAGFRPINPNPGMSFFDSAESFAMFRGRHMDCSVIGAFQVTDKGDLASWTRVKMGGKWTGILGGSMEVTIAKRVIAAMEHILTNGEFKIVKQLTLPLTRKKCIDLIVTDLAVIEVTEEGLVLKEMLPGWNPEEIQALTEPTLIISPDLKEMILG